MKSPFQHADSVWMGPLQKTEGPHAGLWFYAITDGKGVIRSYGNCTPGHCHGHLTPADAAAHHRAYELAQINFDQPLQLHDFGPCIVCSAKSHLLVPVYDGMGTWWVCKEHATLEWMQAFYPTPSATMKEVTRSDYSETPFGRQCWPVEEIERAETRTERRRIAIAAKKQARMTSDTFKLPEKASSQ